MKIALERCTAALGLLVGLCLAPSAHALDTWTFTNSDGDVPGTTYSDSIAGGPTVALAGYYATNTAGVVTGNWAKADLTNQNGAGQGICSANDSDGVVCDQPDHAVDNNVNTEAVLLSFSKSVVLSSIGLGWTNGSVTADLSLFRWIGPGGPPSSMVGANAVTNPGWQLVGNYGDMATDTTLDPNYNKVNTGVADGSGAAGAGGKGSSWWLVSAYNSGFTQSAGAENRSSLGNGSDYFKLYAVAGSLCTSTVTGVCGPKVPEPGSLALAGVAIFGLFYTRRQLGQRKA